MTAAGSAFSPSTLAARLASLLATPPRRYVVAFSGGLDSTVLLHALHAAGLPLRAVHINHQLQADADAWARHCQHFCAALAIDHVDRLVDVDLAGRGMEEAAREARYGALAGELGEGEVLVTAQHQDDQVETLLLRLLRGSGVQGLAAMAPVTPFAGGHLLRPLLDHPRRALADYALRHGLTWMDDPANDDLTVPRNFLRHEILPRLAGPWPGYRAAIARSAGHMAEAQALLDELAAGDLAPVEEGRLPLDRLRPLSRARQRNLLRDWLQRQGAQVPATRKLEAALDSMLQAAPDRQPRVTWGDVTLGRFRDVLYLLPQGEALAEDWCASWDGEQPLVIEGQGRLLVERTQGRGLSRKAIAGQTLQVRARRGGERIRLAGQAHHTSLKRLCQECGIPPWQRQRLLLVYVHEQLAAVVGLGYAEEFAAAEDEEGISLKFKG